MFADPRSYGNHSEAQPFSHVLLQGLAVVLGGATTEVSPLLAQEKTGASFASEPGGDEIPEVHLAVELDDHAFRDADDGPHLVGITSAPSGGITRNVLDLSFRFHADGNIPDDVVVRTKASFIDPMPRISDQNESLWELLAQRVKNSWFLTAGGSLFLCRTLAIREFHVRAPPAGYRHVRSCRAAELQPGSGVEAINRVLHNL
jgi:hypothetical protein